MSTTSMSSTEFNNLLRPSLFVWGVMGVVLIPLCVYFDPFQGWRWVPFNIIYEQMIVSIYVSIGVMSFIAMRSPIHHLSFLWFVAVSSFAHGLTMLFHAATTPLHRGHLLGHRGGYVPLRPTHALRTCDGEFSVAAITERTEVWQHECRNKTSRE